MGTVINFTSHPLIKHRAPWLPDGFIGVQVCGSSGCGKSTAMLQLAPNIANLRKIVVLSLIGHNAPYMLLARWARDTIGTQHGEPYYEFNDPISAERGIQRACDELRECDGYDDPDPQKQPWGLCIMDDFMLDTTKNSPYRLCVEGVTRLMRNMNFHFVYIAQSYLNAPAEAINNRNVLMMFRMNDARAVNAACDVFTSAGFGDESYFRACQQRMLDGGRYSYLTMVLTPDGNNLYLHAHNQGAGAFERLETRSDPNSMLAMRSARRARPSALRDDDAVVTGGGVMRRTVARRAVADIDSALALLGKHKK